MSRARCPFTFRGRPSTPPGTPEDALRIQLSQRLTALLVEGGAERAGDYTMPGADGYTDYELSTAATHYAHLQEEPPPEPDALACLRAAEIAQAVAAIPFTDAELLHLKPKRKPYTRTYEKKARL